MTDIKDQLKDISIDQVAESLGLGLQKHGANLQGECPSGHGSKGGKCFSLNLKGNYFSCFQCGAGGDVIRLVELARGFSFPEALKWLAENFRPNLLPHLARAKVETDPKKQEYYQRASLYDLIYQHGKELLYQEPGREALRYLQEARGYSLEKLRETDWICWPPEKDIRAYLKRLQPEAGEQIKALKLSGYYGDIFRLAFPYRDRRGAITGYLKRATAPEGITGKAFDGKAFVNQRWDSTPGLEKYDLFNLCKCRGMEELVVLEGYPDALYFPTIGLKNVVAVGQGLLSRTHLEGLKAFGVKRLILSLDNDQVGPENTAKALETLRGTGIRAFVVNPPLLAPHKDPDELVKAEGLEAYQKLLEGAELASRWQARHIASKHDLATDLGLDRALGEAWGAYSTLGEGIDQKAFEGALREATALTGDDIKTRWEVFAEEASKKQAEKTLKELARKLEARASGGDIAGAVEELRGGLQALQQGRSFEAPAPYLLGELIADIEGTVEGLKTGYWELDRLISIPQGAITIIAGRPGHGKTTLQLNLLLNMLRAYPDKRFFFFSYEEARKFIALKLIMNLARAELNQEANLGAYVNYFKEKRGQDSQDPAYQRIEEGIQEYGKLVSSGRLIISDRTLPGEELASLIGHLARPGEVGAVFVDYIQKIPLQTFTGGHRYQEIKKVSELLLEQAVTQDLALIMGAQLTRPDKKSPKPERVVRLDNLRESGDIEQDANLVLGLYNDSVAKMEEEKEVKGREVSLEVHILKNRAGIAGKKVTLTFDRPVLRIKDRDKKKEHF